MNPSCVRTWTVARQEVTFESTALTLHPITGFGSVQSAGISPLHGVQELGSSDAPSPEADPAMRRARL